MKKITVHIDLNLVGCTRKVELEISDEDWAEYERMPELEREEALWRDWIETTVWNHVNVYWEEE